MGKRTHISSSSWDKRKTIILVIAVIFVVGLGFLFSLAGEKYGQQYAISLTALLVASIAAGGYVPIIKMD